MKRIILATMVAVMGLSLVAPSARAFGIYGIWWDADDAKDDGLGFGFRSKVQVAPLVSFDTRASWIKFSDDDVSVYPIEATGMIKLGMLYAGAGVGYYFFGGDVDLDDDFGWYLVGGIDLGAGRVGVFGEVKWISLDSDINGVTPSQTMSLDGIGVNAGLMFGM